jgi:hypothetical protein
MAGMTLGVAMPWQMGEDWTERVLSRLGQPVWYNWKHDYGVAGYTPMLWRCNADDTGYPTKPFAAACALMAQSGCAWYAGNEPDRSDQSATAPRQFAEAVRRLQTAAPNASVAIPGVVWDADGYRWLEEYLACGGPVTGAWHVHIYGPRTPDEWSECYDNFGDWLAHHGLTGPVAITETLAWSTDFADQLRLMEYLHERNDVMAYWYAGLDYTRSLAWSQSGLADHDGNLTELGRRYVALRERTELYLPVV